MGVVYCDGKNATPRYRSVYKGPAKLVGSVLSVMPSWSASRRPNPGACVKTDAAAKAMKTKSLISRFAVGAGLVATYIWAFYFTHGTTGYNSVTSNGATSVSAGTDPKSLLMSPAGLAIYVIILSTTVEVQGFHVAPMWRRAAAFIVDFWFSVFTMGALLEPFPCYLKQLALVFSGGIFSVTTESQRTKLELHWLFLASAPSLLIFSFR